MLKRAALLALLLCALVLCQPLEVTSETLPNGMKVLVHEDHDIPNVAMYFFFKVGSRNERPGATGVSHFFEHMMFNGAKKYGFKQFDIHMEKNGGRNNAYTTEDDTVYTDFFPNSMLELMMDMESDRIRDLAFDPKIVESERGVVYSERRNSDDDNARALYEQLKGTAFLAHPYSWPVLGWASDIEAWTIDDLRSHFRMGYSPNNCVMVIVGDFKTEDVLKLARQYLGPIPAHEPPPAVRTREPEQKGERRVTLVRPAQLPMQLIAYHTPQSNSPEHYALEALAGILAEGRSSRLYRRLVDRDQIAIDVGKMTGLSLDPGLMIFSIQPNSGVDPARTEQAFLEEIERVRTGGVTPEELEKAKNQMLAGLYREMKAISGKADLLGQYELFFGDHRKLFSAGGDIQKITAADVQKAAKQYLDAKNRTVATLIPEKPEAAQ